MLQKFSPLHLNIRQLNFQYIVKMKKRASFKSVKFMAPGSRVLELGMGSNDTSSKNSSFVPGY